MAVADLWTVLSVGGQHVVESVLPRIDGGDEGSDLRPGKGAFDVEADLLLHPEVVNGTFIKVKGITEVAHVEVTVACLHVGITNSHKKGPG